MSERDALREGQRLDGRYHLVERLTDWGVGECWRARDVEAHTRVVVKLLPPLAPGDARRAAEFQSLVRRLVKFRHRGVAATLASGVFESRPYLVLEHLDGVSLGAALSRARTASRLLEPGMLVNLFDRTLEALTAAHGDARPLVHGALTPASVLAALVDGRLVVRVLDFGLATVFGPRLRDRAAGEYVAPELDDDPERVTPACDVFALGAMLTEAVTDRRTASGGVTATVGGLSAVATRREDMPNALLGVASRAMRVDPDGRFATVAALHDAFNAAWGAHPEAHDDAPALDTAPAVSWERYADEALAAPTAAMVTMRACIDASDSADSASTLSIAGFVAGGSARHRRRGADDPARLVAAQRIARVAHVGAGDARSRPPRRVLTRTHTHPRERGHTPCMKTTTPRTSSRRGASSRAIRSCARSAWCTRRCDSRSASAWRSRCCASSWPRGRASRSAFCERRR